MTKEKRNDTSDTRWRADRRYKPPEWVLAARCPVVVMPGAAPSPILQPHTLRARKRAANVLEIANSPVFRGRRLQRMQARLGGDSLTGPSQLRLHDGERDSDKEREVRESARHLLAAFNTLCAHLTPEQRASLVAQFVAGAL